MSQDLLQIQDTLNSNKLLVDKQQRFHFLDGIRGIAATMIVIHHAFSSNIRLFFMHHNLPLVGSFLQLFTQSGVDLFFVLSGVVLLRPYLRKQKTFKVGEYFIRRLRRIYPPYFFALIIGAAIVYINNTFPTWYNIRGFHMGFSFLELFKEAFIINFDGQFFNLAWWSLGIEILFYIVAPIIVFNFHAHDKISNFKIAATISGTLICTLALQILLSRYVPYLYSLTTYVSTIGRCVEYPVCFLMGVFLAARDFDIKHGIWFLISGLVFIFTGFVLTNTALCSYFPSVFSHPFLYYSIFHSGYGLLYAGIITLAFNLNSLKAFLDNNIMIWLGERSYSLFLIHFSVFYFTDNLVSHFTSDRNAWYGILTRGIGIPFAFFMAMLLFWFVERKQARGLLTGKIFWPWQIGRLGKINS